MSNIFSVILIMACAIVGTIALLFLAGASRWSFIYLICYRLLKRKNKEEKYNTSTKKDIIAVVVAIISIIVAAILIIYGIPFVIDNIPQLQQ